MWNGIPFRIHVYYPSCDKAVIPLLETSGQIFPSGPRNNNYLLLQISCHSATDRALYYSPHPDYFFTPGRGLFIMADVAFTIAAFTPQHCRYCIRVSPQRQLTPCMTAVQPPRRAEMSTGPDAQKSSLIEDGVKPNDECPVYCYVACSPTQSDYLERVLTSNVYDVVSETPVEVAKLLSDRFNNTIWLKREDTTDIKSFKVRGAYNMMAKAGPAALSAGVVAASAGNHAQGVALAAERLRVPATIVMPAVTPQIKVEAVRRRGATAILHGDNFDEAKSRALDIADREGKLFVPPFDHPDIIAGQGTVGLELIRQLPKFDAVFVPVGGGGLIAGIATIVKRLRPEVKIIGVEPIDSPAMHDSLRTGTRTQLKTVGTFADGVAVVEVGQETFRLCRELVDDVVLVSNDEICGAIKDMFEDTRSILEPSGALAVAGLKAWVQRRSAKNLDLVAIASGANTNFDVLRHVSERADIGEGREGIFAITIQEQPGSFLKLINAIGPNVNITEFNYRCRDDKEAHVFVGARLLSKDESREIIQRVTHAEMEAVDLTDDEMAKLHVRHLVGGAVPSVELEEAVYRFEFPERPGALLKFLAGLPKGFNITMFHYRNHGADVGRVLVGLNHVARDSADKDEEKRLLDEFVNRLGYKYTREDDNVAYKLFLSNKKPA